MSTNSEFIKNEKQAIEEDFEKAFYYIISMIPFLRESISLVKNAAIKGNDKSAAKYANQLGFNLSNFSFQLEQFESKFKTENNKVKEQIRTALKERIELTAISLTRIPFERHADFIAMLYDFYMGNYKHIEESVLDALLDHEESNTIEGLGLVHEINPNLTVEQKEHFARRLQTWSDCRNINQMVKQ